MYTTLRLIRNHVTVPVWRPPVDAGVETRVRSAPAIGQQARAFRCFTSC